MVRRGVGQHADDGDRSEQYPRTESAPAAAGAVGNQPYVRPEIASSARASRNMVPTNPAECRKYSGVEKHHIQHDVIKNDVAGGVSHAVANLLLLDNTSLIFYSSFTLVGAETGCIGFKLLLHERVLRFLLLDYVSCFLMIAVNVGEHKMLT